MIRKILLTITLSFLILELILRISIGQLSYFNEQKAFEDINIVELSLNQSLGYKLKPNFNGFFRGKEFITNKFGFRSKEFKKTGKKKKVIGLGDSVMMGWGIEQSSHFLSQLEKELPIEFYNLGVVGYNTRQELLTLKKYIDMINPSCIVFLFVANDSYPNWNRYQKLPVNSYSYLFNLLQVMFKKIVIKDKKLYTLKRLNNLERKYSLENELSELIKFVKNKNINMITLLDSRYQIKEFSHDMIERKMVKHGIKTLDLFKELRSKEPHKKFLLGPHSKDEHNTKLLIGNGDGHPNKHWHLKVKELVRPLVRSSCL
jgi:hypothetical protein